MRPPLRENGRVNQGGSIMTENKSAIAIEQQEQPKVSNEQFEIVHQKSEAFYPTYERKGDLQQQTHYCPGCGHGVAHKLIAEALEELGSAERHDLGQPGRLLRLRLLLLRRGQRASRARPRSCGGYRIEARLSRTRSSSPIRATAISRPSAPRKLSMPPIAAKKSPSSSSTTRFTA